MRIGVEIDGLGVQHPSQKFQLLAFTEPAKTLTLQHITLPLANFTELWFPTRAPLLQCRKRFLGCENHIGRINLFLALLHHFKANNLDFDE